MLGVTHNNFQCLKLLKLNQFPPPKRVQKKLISPGKKPPLPSQGPLQTKLLRDSLGADKREPTSFSSSVKLKRLEIIGFKSFMDKTVVTFDKDIIGVVGPNGCGKSNIVDAIRWVMGEMSAKHLRGKLMEDVIFAGSEKRPATSMASVELTFSTEGYQTPAAYLNHAEISICRRLFRTGESEYYINKTPVRLRDITDLFLGTGIGKKAYSVIEQGRVSEIITAKPEDRRYYIEEVAGISKFKARKDQALRKMEATQINLERLNDVVGEISRQMSSLDRQAKKATKYKEIRDEFRKWDLALSSNQYIRRYQRQEELEKLLSQLDQQEEGSKTELNSRESSIEEQRLKLLEDEKELQTIQGNLFELTNYIRVAEAKIGHKKTEAQSLAQQQQNLRHQQEELESEQHGLSNGLLQINEQKGISDLEIEALKLTVNSLEQGTQTANQAVETLLHNSDDLKTRIAETETRLAEISALKNSITERRSATTDRLQVHKNEFALLKEQFAQSNRFFADAQQDLNALRQLEFDLNSRTGNLTDQLNTQESKLGEQQAALTKLRDELTLRRSRLASLEELQRNFEGYRQGTKSVLLNREKIAPDGVFGTVADLVETEPEYEGAVSAVLGERLEYVIVKSHAEGLDAVDYLKQSAAGRTSFIPIGVRAGASTPAPLLSTEAEGVLGPLKHYVSLKNSNQALSEFLFGDVVLVSDLKNALNLWALNGHKQRFVTLGGEVIDTSGVITGGSVENTERALLAKKREIKELYQQIAGLAVDVEEKGQSHQRLVAHVTALKQQLSTIKDEQVQEAIKISNQQKDISHFEKEIQGLRVKQDDLVIKIEKEAQELAQLTPELDRLSNEEQELHASLHDRRNRLEAAQAQLVRGKTDFELQSSQLTVKKIEHAQAQERSQHLADELDRIQDELYDLRIEQAGVEQALAMSEFLSAFKKAQQNHLLKVLNKKLDQQSLTEQRLREKRDVYQAGHTQIQQAELKIKRLRQDLDQTSEKLNQATIELTELRAELKHLIEQCFERHQLNLPTVFHEYRDENLDEIEGEARIMELKEKLARIGPVNTEALEEYESLKGRYEFLVGQQTDLQASLQALDRVIHKINRTTRERFGETFELVNKRFRVIFRKLFRGGEARLVMTDENNLLETGVDIVAQPPGKKLQSISLLSGGEKALTAVSLIFAIFQIKPSPFCILDEVDAPLDDINVGRYNDILREMTNRTQFILITHNKKTMELADILYGVTMQEAGISQVVSVQLN